MKALRVLAAIAAFVCLPIAAAAQVTPAAGSPVISSSAPPGAFNLYPYLSALPLQGVLKMALFTVSCTPAASTSCTATATAMVPTSGTGATQFAAAPLCFNGQAANSVAVLDAIAHSFNGSFTTDTPTLYATASTSSLLAATELCIGP